MAVNWRTNVGGAVGTLGSSLIGIAVIPVVAGGPPSKLMAYIAFAGFILSAIGKSLAALFAADAKVVKDLRNEVDQTTVAIKTGDTSFLNKPV